MQIYYHTTLTQYSQLFFFFFFFFFNCNIHKFNNILFTALAEAEPNALTGQL